MSTTIATKTIVSYGAGLDSTAVLVEMYNRGWRPDLILFADPGAEHPETYDYIPIMNTWLRSVGFPEITVVRYQPTRVAYWSLEEKCLRNETLPSLAYGGSFHSCALVFKRDTQDKFLKIWAAPHVAAGGKLVHVIGYDSSVSDLKRAGKANKLHAAMRASIAKRAAEGKKPLASQWSVANGVYAYPLQDWGLERGQLAAIVEAAGLPVPRKSCCYFCPASKPAEVVELRQNHPELFERAVAIEDRARTGKHGLKTKQGLGMGGWSWNWLRDVDDPAEAAGVLRARGARVGDTLRP